MFSPKLHRPHSTQRTVKRTKEYRHWIAEPLESRVLLAGIPVLFVANNSGTVGEYDAATGAAIKVPVISGLTDPIGIAISGSDIFVTDQLAGTIGEYTTAGATVNASLVTGLKNPGAIAVSGSDLFVANGDGTIGEYTTAGATVNASLVTGLYDTSGIAISGSDLFVADVSYGKIGEYTTAGATINASLISTVFEATGIAVSGSDLFVTYDYDSGNAGTIGEYTTAGATVNASLVSSSALAFSSGLALSGSDLFVLSSGAIGEYTTSGKTINASLVSGFSVLDGYGIAEANLPAVVTTYPTDQGVAVGQTANFTAKAIGTSRPRIHWQLSTDRGRTFDTIPGSTHTTYSLTMTSASIGDQYRAVFTTPQGSATTPPATLALPEAVSGIVYSGVNRLGEKVRLAGVAMILQKLKGHKAVGFAQTTTTDAKGYYMFSNLIAGRTYQISKFTPVKYKTIQPADGAYVVNLAASQILTGEDFRVIRHGGSAPALAARNVFNADSPINAFPDVGTDSILSSADPSQASVLR
jgi:hypothetical protein